MFTTHLAYIKELQKQNSRDRFHANKELYNNLRQELIDLSQELIYFFNKDLPLWELDPKKCVFRINRDMRFVKDDRLYKNNMWLEIAPWGRRSGLPSFYIHIEPWRCFIGWWLYAPDKDVTQSIRQAILKDGKTLTQIYKDLYNEWFHPYAERALVSAPRGYDEKHKYIELLRQKDRIFSKWFTDKQFTSKNIVKTIKKEFKKLIKLNLWLLNAIDNEI